MTNFKIDITELLLKESGSSIEFSFPLHEPFNEHISFTPQSELYGQITNIDGFLLIDFTVSEFQLQEACVRCLTEIKQITSIDQVSESYSLTDAKQNSFELISEDADTHQQMLDITPLVSQELLLSQKTNVLCKDNCVGLCQQCGQNLNNQSCACKPMVNTESPFAKLKDNPHFKS